jgi:beta-mannanase
VTWEPWDADAPDNGAYALDRIAAGEHDGYLVAWADALRAWGRPVLLRFAHEQNGDWYPWAVGVGGTSAEDHVTAFRHVHDVFSAQGAGNVQFVWNPNVSYPGASSLSVTWPGARYVDRVALDGYNWGNSAPDTAWQEPEEVFADSLDELRELAPGIPVMVAEVGCAEEGGDKAAWVSDLVAWLDDQADVAAFVWFEHDKEADWRIASSSASAAAMRDALAGRRLVAR